jgi:Na+-transporting methylmalonyl-CoA/oxaloacetate decarboxylase gamma subunit
MLTVLGIGFTFLFLTGLILAMKCLKYIVEIIDKRFPQNTTDNLAADNGIIAVAIACAKKILNK